MFGTAKVRLPYAVRVRGTWSGGHCEERSDIEEPVNWRGDELMKICQLGCWLYFVHWNSQKFNAHENSSIWLAV